MSGTVIDLSISLGSSDLYAKYKRPLCACLVVFLLEAAVLLSHLNDYETRVMAFQVPGVEKSAPIMVEMVSDDGKPLLKGPDGRYYTYWKTVRSKVTAYTPDAHSCGEFADGKTSIGQNAWQMDGVAADPQSIPYGTLVYIPDAGYREVDDTGSAMRNSWRKKSVVHFDLRMTYRHQARQWGVRWYDVDLYQPFGFPST